MKSVILGQSVDLNTGAASTHLYDSPETGAWLAENQPVDGREFTDPLVLECPDDFDVTSIGGIDSADPADLATLAELFGFNVDDFDSPQEVEANAEQVQAQQTQSQA